jgi:4-hydroxy-tetrahydrodipicolinate synthase
MTDAIHGFWVAVPTPLTAEGQVDHAMLTQHAKGLFAQGVDGVVLFGTTGEGTSFSASERLATVEAMLKAGIATTQIGLGAGFPALTESVALARSALGLGLTQVLILPPNFYRDVTDAGVEDVFAEIFDRIDDDRLRATLYHIPQVSGVGVPAVAAANLRRRFGRIVAGLKDSSGQFAQFQAFRAAAPDIAITVGNETDIARAVAAGGAGTICGMANIAPELVRAMFTDAGAETPMAAAVGLMANRPFVPTLKAILAEQTGEPGWARVRAPLRASREGAILAANLQSVSRKTAA